MPRPRVTGRSSIAGYSLIETMIVMTIVGILAALAVPNYVRYQRTARVGVTIAELKALSQGFIAYSVGHEGFPPESEGALPPGMATYVDPDTWARETPLGGHYEWEGPDAFPYAGISITPPGALSEREFEIIDRNLDDGDPATGRFRIGTNGRPTYILGS